MSDAPIGIFDSGFGGLTVMRAIVDLLPHENIVYFGDTARLPYGEKSAENVLRFSLENAAFLSSQRIKLLVIACSTACSVGAVEILQDSLPIPVIGMIDPALDELQKVVNKGEIVVLGTRRTIQSGIYQRKLQTAFPAHRTRAIACPLFVPLVEEGYAQHKLAELAAAEYLHPLLGKEIGAVLLACTHYPLLQSILHKILGEETTLIDPGHACARSVQTLLKEQGLLNPSKAPPQHRFFVSDDPEKFRNIGQLFLRSAMHDVALISPSEYTPIYAKEFS